MTRNLLAGTIAAVALAVWPADASAGCRSCQRYENPEVVAARKKAQEETEEQLKWGLAVASGGFGVYALRSLLKDVTG